MADEFYKRLSCGGCGNTFARPVQRGRHPHRCKPCLAEPAPDPHPSGVKPCLHCGNTFDAWRSGVMYCGTKCAQDAQRVKKAGKPKAQPPRALLPERCCAHCEKRFVPSWRNPNKAMYCSKGCKVGASQVRLGYSKSPRQRAMDDFCRALRSIAKRRERHQRRADAVASGVARRSARQAEQAELRARQLAPRLCKSCGGPFEPRNVGSDRCHFCVESHARAMRKAHKKAYKMRKRAAVVEVFCDTEILDRDGWHCQLCGNPPPKRLRGTYEPNAPEVDHIIAIANGGAHARWNCQCACRQCNLAKGAGPARGQLSLVMA